ncbi:hypothetical protein DPX16_13724 [Anabarilius grahami]|uniref:Uncharacterized protein n=1 Tax=Anabarilius grahami TaxID=495550 RepID=A0A3N0XRZ2_ANAGA|nr:hypothetical protein DPX16_13724 [Anabarilius grahami]
MPTMESKLETTSVSEPNVAAQSDQVERGAAGAPERGSWRLYSTHGFAVSSLSSCLSTLVPPRMLIAAAPPRPLDPMVLCCQVLVSMSFASIVGSWSANSTVAPLTIVSAVGLHTTCALGVHLLHPAITSFLVPPIT